MDRTQINAYIDGELSGEEKAEIESIIANDPGLRDEYLWTSRVKSCVQSKIQILDNPELWTKCSARLGEVDRATQTETIVRKFRGALAGVVAMSILAGAFVYRVNPGALTNDNLARTLSASSVSFPTSKPSDERQAATWIQDQTNRETRMPPISRGYLQVVEVGIIDCHPEGRVGRVVYTDGESQYFLLAFPVQEEQPFQPLKGAPGVGWSRVGQLNAVGWRQGDQWLVFAGPKSVRELFQMIQ